MISISTVNSNQTSAANREITTSAKTVRMKDILGLRKAVKYVENLVTTFNRDLQNPTHWQRPNVNSLRQLLADINLVSARANQLTAKIESSSYPHHASKMANLGEIKATIDTLNKNVSTSFNRSQKNMHVMREREDRYQEDRVNSARARSERRQYVNEMINSGRGDELYNGGMVK